MVNFILLKDCIYCRKAKPQREFSDEHVWPYALGGDFLPRLWCTNDVCPSCNSPAGVFVDAAYIKSWFGVGERWSGSLDYLGKDNPINVTIPLNYAGVIKDPSAGEGEVAEFWIGPCGANIIHIRPADKEETWAAYASGDPRLKKSRAGRAYMAVTTEEEYWILVSLKSFKSHFKLARRFSVNLILPDNLTRIAENIDRNDPQQAADLKIVDAVSTNRKRSEWLHFEPAIQIDAGNRLLAKTAYALGYNLFGYHFLQTDEAENLRRYFREAKQEKRAEIPVRGSGPLRGMKLGSVEGLIAWPGGWVLMLTEFSGTVGLTIVSPLKQVMSIVVSTDARLIRKLPRDLKGGVIWVTIPSLGQAVGPISLTDYLGHVSGSMLIPALSAIEAKRTLFSELPKCRPDDADAPGGSC